MIKYVRYKLCCRRRLCALEDAAFGLVETGAWDCDEVGCSVIAEWVSDVREEVGDLVLEEVDDVVLEEVGVLLEEVGDVVLGEVGNVRIGVEPAPVRN
jgi:hypothetical protein